MACWRVLRTWDQLSGAASTTKDLSVDLDDSSDADTNTGSTSSLRTPKNGDQRRPYGIKAAKLMRLEEAIMEKQA